MTKEATITVTLKQLADAVFSGAYFRFSKIRKTITAGHKNRKTPAAVWEETKLFEERRDAIVNEYNGTLKADRSGYDWPADRQEDASKAVAELLAQTVELPGCQIRLSDLLEGGLLEEDYNLLEPWLTD